MYHHLDENNSSSSTQQVQVDVLQHFSLNSMLYTIEKYSTQQVPTAVHPPTYLYMACSYMESNSVLVADGNTTSNSMFARLGTDYEIRNQWFFTILEAMTTD